MFDFAWSEIALIGVVALVLIGPKDLPVAIKAVTGMVKKARRMAAEFQTHVDDMVKDADLKEVRDQIREIRSLDIRGTIARAVDRDGTIREALQDPIRTPPPPAVPVVEPPAAPEPAIAAPDPALAAPNPAHAASMPATATPEPALAAPETGKAEAPAPMPPALPPPTPVPHAAMPASAPPDAEHLPQP